MGGLATLDEDGRRHHADLRNLPTLRLGVVPLGGSLTSLYIDDERPSGSASGSGSGRQRNEHATSTTTTTTPSGNESSNAASSTLVSRKGKEKSTTSSTSTSASTSIHSISIDSSTRPRPRNSPPHRDREISGETFSTTRANSSFGGSDTDSLAPSDLPSVLSSGNSYSAEMYDQITPLRDPYLPSTSKRRSVPTMGPIYEVASVPVVTGNVSGEMDVSGVGGAIPSGGPGSNTYQYGIGTIGERKDRDQDRDRDRDRDWERAGPSGQQTPPPLPSPNRPRMSPSMGLSEILATPSHREVKASREARSPYERHHPSPSPRNINPDTSSREIDYFNLPISHREGSVSAYLERTLTPGQRSHSGDDPPKPRSEPLPEDASISTPSWSSSDITSLTHSSSLKSPRIRNEGMLAPHGSFTSDSGRQYQAQAKLKRAESIFKESTGSGESIGSWRGNTASNRTTDESGRKLVSEKQYVEYVKEAMNGDQLALHRLGWASDNGHDRHSLGDADLVWGGAAEPGSPSAFSSRSSVTSRQSVRSNSTSYARSQSGRTGPGSTSGQTQTQTQRQGPQEVTGPDLERVSSRRSSGEFSRRSSAEIQRPPSRQQQTPPPPTTRPAMRQRTSSTGSDLFADVAHMTLQSNARNNRAGTGTPGQEIPPPTPGFPSASTMRTSPSPMRRTGYFDDQALDHPRPARPTLPRKSSSSFRSVDPLMDKQDSPKDPVKEKERREERERRRAFRAEAARRPETASSTSESTMKISRNRETSGGSGSRSGQGVNQPSPT